MRFLAVHANVFFRRRHQRDEAAAALSFIPRQSIEKKKKRKKTLLLFTLLRDTCAAVPCVFTRARSYFCRGDAPVVPLGRRRSTGSSDRASVLLKRNEKKKNKENQRDSFPIKFQFGNHVLRVNDFVQYKPLYTNSTENNEKHNYYLFTTLFSKKIFHLFIYFFIFHFFVNETNYSSNLKLSGDPQNCQWAVSMSLRSGNSYCARVLKITYKWFQNRKSTFKRKSVRPIQVEKFAKKNTFYAILS